MSDDWCMTNPLGEIAVGDASLAIVNLRAMVHNLRAERTSMREKIDNQRTEIKELSAKLLGIQHQQGFTMWDARSDAMVVVYGTARAITILADRMKHLDEVNATIRQAFKDHK